MKWIKKGLIFNIDNDSEILSHHVMLPTVDMINNKIWRIYYTGRDKNNQSRPFCIDVEAENPKHIIKRYDDPFCDLGEIGAFDDCGVSFSSIIDFKGKKYAYTGGWNVRNTVSYFCNIGLAISEDNGETWNKLKGPLFSPTYKEPFFAGSCFVLQDDDLLRIYYTSCDGWEIIDGKPEPYYNIKYAQSTNGLDWDRNAVVSVDYKNGEISGITRPSVLKEDGIYKIWYSYRDKGDYRTNPEHSYRIGYGESKDGIHFERMDDKVGIDISKEGWDSQMICYPHVIKSNEKYYMFYNGNGFGQSGFGWAELGQ